MLIPFWYKWANSNSLGSFGPNFWGWRVKKHNNYQDCIDSWLKRISCLDICFKSVYLLKRVQNEHVSIMDHNLWLTKLSKSGQKDHDSKYVLWSQKSSRATYKWCDTTLRSIRDCLKYMIHDDIFHVKDEQVFHSNNLSACSPVERRIY